jgi:predicted metal-dependent hydrolase
MNNTTLAQPVESTRHVLWWNDGNALRSRILDAISLIVPSGETFVIASVSEGLLATNRSRSTTDELKQEVERFVREEHSHTRAHRLYNDRLAAHAPSRQLEQHIERMVLEMADWRLPTRLAMASALEQLTAVLAKEALRPGSVWLSPGETPQTRLWRWHCQEELDHRHVARDVMLAAGVGHTQRIVTLLMAMAFFVKDIIGMLWGLLRADLAAGRVSAWQLAAQCAKFGVCALPSLVRMAWNCGRYAVSARC